MSWLIASAAGYFLIALGTLSDKILLEKDLPHPAVYAFYASGLSILAVFLLPFAPGTPPLPFLFLSLLAGGTFAFALLTFYSLLKAGEASRIAPLVGSLVPVFTLVLAWAFLGEMLAVRELVAFLVILLGSTLVLHHAHRGIGGGSGEFRTFALGLLAALLFAVSHVTSKFIYEELGFVNGLVWRSVGSFVAALSLLFFAEYRREIAQDATHTTKRGGLLFFFGKACGGGGSIFVNYAFTLGSVALVNALAGLQYVFVFLFAVFLSKEFPHVLAEELSRSALRHKIGSLLVLGAGIAILFS